ncbi:MAG: hypothetical protein HRU19_03100 [Pseudobacteriovorax sp.]|nr:hypothetical protein [Pseudobacteriovorax sp.]
MKHLIFALGLVGLTSSAMGATSYNAKRMQVASESVRAGIERIERECAPKVRENKADLFILDRLLPAIDEKLEEAEELFSDASFILEDDPRDFDGRRTFRRGCSKTSQATLRIGTARIQSLDANIFTPYADEFADLEDELEFARDVADC